MDSKKQSIQITIVPSDGGKIRSHHVSKRLFWSVLGICIFTGVMTLTSIGFGIYVLSEGSPYTRLQLENQRLRTSLAEAEEDIGFHQQRSEAIGYLAHSLRTIIGADDGELQREPQRSVLYADGERTRVFSEDIDSDLGMRLARFKQERSLLNEMGAEADQLSNEVKHWLQQEPDLVKAIPSIRPLQSDFPHSAFGPRTNPKTDRIEVHKGIDIPAPVGTDVHATADGIVVYSGYRGNYGRTVIVSHRLGYQTHYAHLAASKVRVGKEVQRGDVIAQSGESGRVTGPHLHYEVRRKGIPIDPELFFLEDVLAGLNVHSASAPEAPLEEPTHQADPATKSEGSKTVQTPATRPTRPKASKPATVQSKPSQPTPSSATIPATALTAPTPNDAASASANAAEVVQPNETSTSQPKTDSDTSVQ